MWSSFSKKKETEKPRITEQDKAILTLKQQRDKLKQYQKKIQLSLENERKLAKQLLKEGKKDKAKLLLKKKRHLEQTLEKTENQLDNLEKMVQDVEFAQAQIQVADVLKQGREALKKILEVMSIQPVKEGIEYQREVDELLSRSLTQEDEDAVLQELEEMTQSVTENLPGAPSNATGL